MTNSPVSENQSGSNFPPQTREDFAGLYPQLKRAANIEDENLTPALVISMLHDAGIDRVTATQAARHIKDADTDVSMQEVNAFRAMFKRLVNNPPDGEFISQQHMIMLAESLKKLEEMQKPEENLSPQEQKLVAVMATAHQLNLAEHSYTAWSVKAQAG